MVTKLIAGLTLAVCMVLLLRLCIRARPRERVDASLRRAWSSTRRAAVNVWHWRAARRQAQQAADAAIQRAQRKAASAFERDGNVYKPDAFRGSQPDAPQDETREPKNPRDPRNLH